MFEKTQPGREGRAVGTGPGDAGSQKIYEKLEAQKKGGAATSDVDVVGDPPEDAAGTMVQRGPARRSTATRSPPATLVTRDTRRRTRSAPTSTGYVMPMFH